MRIQNLAVIFIIIVLPISLVLATYTQNRVETLSMQARYDSKLNDATYDALKAYQINSFNSDASYLTNSKMRDIKASVNTFFSSLTTNFSTLGYSKETLQNYVPALVYTMYDGYYIYSPYTNTWDEETKETHKDDVSYQNGESLYGLKPYIYYSCRYKGRNSKGTYDVIITYSLDNYISIQGTVASGKPVSKYGYLLSDVRKLPNGEVNYNGINIVTEPILEENVCVDGKVSKYKYIKKNGTKYYKSNDGKVFSVVNGKSVIQNNFNFPNTDDSAKKYYLESLEIREFIETYLSGLHTNNIVDINGNTYSKENPYSFVRRNI